jgi:hypothetical protein
LRGPGLILGALFINARHKYRSNSQIDKFKDDIWKANTKSRSSFKQRSKINPTSMPKSDHICRSLFLRF